MKMDFINSIPNGNYSNFMTEGMEVDEVAVEFGDIAMPRRRYSSKHS